MKPQCILCGAGNTRLREVVKAPELTLLYARKLGIDTARLLGEDVLKYSQCPECGLLFFDPLAEGDEAFYAALQTFPWYYAADKPEFDMACAFLGQAASVLDVGCGAGDFSLRLPGRDYVGLEFSPAALERALAKGLRVLRQPVEDFAAAHPEAFDAVCSFQVLEHVRRPRQFLEAMAACLRPGGTLVVSVPSRDAFSGLVVNDILDMPPHHLSHWRDAVFEWVAQALGLELLGVRHEALQPYHHDFYTNAMACRMVLRSRTGRAPRLVEMLELDPEVAAEIAAVKQLIHHELLQPEIRPAGHTVLAAFRKPAA